MNKLQEMLAITTAVTGLSFDDFLKEALAETSDDKSRAKMENIIKMSNHLKADTPTVDEWESEYESIRELPGHGKVGLHNYIFTTGIVCGLNDFGYSGRYCYENFDDAATALEKWDGNGDPSGPWIKYKGRGGEKIGPGATDEF